MLNILLLLVALLCVVAVIGCFVEQQLRWYRYDKWKKQNPDKHRERVKHYIKTGVHTDSYPLD